MRSRALAALAGHVLRDLDWRFIFALSLTTIAMGLATSLGATQDSYIGELVGWTILAVPWVWLVLRRGVARPFVTILLVSTIGAVWFGMTNLALWDSYVDTHPDTFVQPTLESGEDPYSAKVKAMNFAISIPIGAAWGALVGLVTLGIQRVRAKRAPSAA